MDTEAATIRDKERFKMLEQKIQDMLLSNIDYRQIVKVLDNECQHSNPDKIAVVEILCKIKDTNRNLNDNDKKSCKEY
jgi:translation initiation factor 2 beta subunit (eIF-2beta)/eIF-5